MSLTLEKTDPGGLVTILFTDIESSTALRQRLGDAKAQELVRTHNTIVRGALKGFDDPVRLYEVRWRD